MKNVLVAADDVHTSAWLSSALDSLDAAIAACPVAELEARLAGEGPALAIVDAGRDPEPLIASVERAAARGSEVKLLVVVEPEGLPGMRLPPHLRADFFVRGGSSEELAARVRTLLWPGEEAKTDELIRVGRLTLNLATYQAYVGAEPIDFTYLEYALFAFLVTHPNRAYGRETLLRRVWGTDYFGGARTVDVHVRRIRSKIGGELSRRLETVRNVGYLWRV